jgi:hypothetical protein
MNFFRRVLFCDEVVNMTQHWPELHSEVVVTCDWFSPPQQSLPICEVQHFDQNHVIHGPASAIYQARRRLRRFAFVEHSLSCKFDARRAAKATNFRKFFISLPVLLLTMLDPRFLIPLRDWHGSIDGVGISCST